MEPTARESLSDACRDHKGWEDGEITEESIRYLYARVS